MVLMMHQHLNSALQQKPAAALVHQQRMAAHEVAHHRLAWRSPFSSNPGHQPS
jgi:hypothetical protein